MVIGSHNSWTFLKPKTWWMKLIAFTAKCQDHDIQTQYVYDNVRCFDLRVRFDNKKLVIAHGIVKYKITEDELYKTLEWLNGYDDVFVRVIHEVRNKKQYTQERVDMFVDFCAYIEKRFPNLEFWCGMNLLPNWSEDYHFENSPSCEEVYASVCPPKIWDDWYPRYFATKHNHETIEKGTDKDILLIDFVNIT